MGVIALYTEFWLWAFLGAAPVLVDTLAGAAQVWAPAVDARLLGTRDGAKEGSSPSPGAKGGLSVYFFALRALIAEEERPDLLENH